VIVAPIVVGRGGGVYDKGSTDGLGVSFDGGMKGEAVGCGAQLVNKMTSVRMITGDKYILTLVLLILDDRKLKLFVLATTIGIFV
jgi:hypothetical protein